MLDKLADEGELQVTGGFVFSYYILNALYLVEDVQFLHCGMVPVLDYRLK